MRDEHILAALFGEPWAILPAKLRAMQEVAIRHLRSERITAEAIDAIVAAAARPRPVSGGAVAVIPVFGVIAQRMNLMSAFSGGTSTEALGRQIQQAVSDPDVSAIVLNVDSPGGSVFGVAELADALFQARGQKPIVAVANSLMASAAYWIASQADEIVATPGGQAGSIGVIAMHEDWSKAEEQEGVGVTLVTAGKHKGEMHPHAPLSDEDRAALQAGVDSYYAMFVKAVARGRGVQAAAVRSGYGEGRVLGAVEAKAAGLVDRIATLDETIARLAGGGRRSGARAEDEAVTVTLAVEETEIAAAVEAPAFDPARLARMKLALDLVEMGDH